jgi:hypothetical protein
MHALICALLTVVLLAIPRIASGEDIDCGFYNEIEITDPAGDATPGAPSYVDVLGVRIRQIGTDIQFNWIANGSPENENGDYFFLFFDTDLNPETGRERGGIGAEIVIGILGPPGSPYINGFDSEGEWITNEPGPDVIWGPEGFTFQIPRATFDVDQVDLYFEASGGTPWSDEGPVSRVVLETPQAKVLLVITADTRVPNVHPPLIYLPDKDEPVQLRAVFKHGGISTPVDASEIDYEIWHHAPHVISNPEAIISIDSNGYAHRHSEGFVSLMASYETCGVSTEEYILAGGLLYGDPSEDHVIAIFPDEYAPKDSPYTFADMMATYPNYIRTVNVEYNITSDLYAGFVPFDGDTQIFALLDIPDGCGGAGNPLETCPCCYMNCGSGVPAYIVAAHEMGHNFHDAPAMAQLLWSNGPRFGANFAYECVASLPVNYMFREIYLNGQDYGLGPGTYEWGFFSQFAEDDNFNILDDFEDYIDVGQTTGYFDMEGIYDTYEIIALFCSFFQAYLYEYEDYSSPYGHDFLRRFLNVWGDEEIPDFQEDKVETYFAASFCAAVGKDVRDKLRYWGFAIDDEFYDQIMPMILSRIELFSDRFEFGDLHKWSVVQP